MTGGGDWSLLPSDLLHSISALLLDSSTIHITRFRSVCAAWRAAASPPPPPLLSPHPISSADPFAPQIDSFSLFKRTIYLLSSPFDPTEPWMVKIEETQPGSKFRVFNPLVSTHLGELKNGWRRIVDLRDVRVLELGEEYVLKFVNRVSGRDWDSLYMEKVAFLRRENGGFVVLTIHISGKLALFWSCERKWVILNDKRLPFDDVIVVDGVFYGVDITGELVRVRVDDDDGCGSGCGVIESHRLIQVAEPVFGGDKKSLVKSGTDLLLVDVYNNMNRYEDSDGDYILLGDEGSDENIGQSSFWFEVFKWDAAGRKWVRVDRLNERVLFLNDSCAFSAYASDLHWSRDNCIWYNFTDDGSDLYRREDPLMCSEIHVFELGSGCTRRLQECGQSYKLFWPLPSWIQSDS